jgi:TonB family protein
MGWVTLLAVSLLGSAPADQAPGEGASQPAGAATLIVDTSAVSPPVVVRHGALDPEKVREVVTAHRDELRSCYERAVLETPGLEGSCTLRIVIAGDGSVGTTSLQNSTIRSVSLGRCLLQLVRTWRFPPPTDGKTAAVDYPLGFRKEAPDAGS